MQRSRVAVRLAGGMVALAACGTLASCGDEPGTAADVRPSLPRAIIDTEARLLDRGEQILLSRCMRRHGLRFWVMPTPKAPQTALHPYVVEDDFRRALAGGTPDGESLAAFADALRREAHALAVRPELTWQQLANRLDPEAPSVAATLAPERERRSRAGAAPWLHIRSPPRRSGALTRTFDPGPDWIAACALTPDARIALGGDVTGGIHTWEAGRGNRRSTFRGHAKPIWDLTVSKDGLVVSASDDHTLRLWRLRTGELRTTLEGHEGAVQTCVLTRDETLLVSASADGTLRLWNLPAGTHRMVCDAGTPLVTCAVAADGTIAVSGDVDGQVIVWDCHDGQPLVSLPRREQRVTALALTPGGHLAVGWEDGLVTLWDVQRCALLASRAGHEERVGCCASSDDGSFLVTGGGEGRVRVWDLPDLTPRATFQAHQRDVEDCALSADDCELLTAGGDGLLKLWSLDQPPPAEQEHAGPVLDCAVSSEGTCVASAGADETVRLWSMADGGWRTVLRGHSRPVLACHVAAGVAGRAAVLSVGRDQTVRHRAADDTMAVLARLESESAAAAFAQDGSWVVAGGLDGSMTMIGLLEDRRPIWRLEHEGQVRACAAAPDSSFAVTAGADCTLRVWSAPDGRPLATLEHHTRAVVGCHVSPEGAIASAGSDGTLGIWEPSTWRLRHGLKGDDRGGMSVCAWSPDERWIASGDSDGELRIWNALTGRLHACQSGHAQIIRACAISSDGRLCATGSADRTVRLWTLPDAEPRGLLPTTGGVWCLAFHPHEPLLICGGDGFVHVLEILPREV